MNTVQIKLTLIEYFSLAVKAFASSARTTVPTRHTLIAIERCSDTIAHIVQYERDNLPNDFQLEHLNKMAGFLIETLKLFSVELNSSGYNVPSHDDVAALLSEIHFYQGKRQ